jgi:hypothetical protein
MRNPTFTLTALLYAISLSALPTVAEAAIELPRPSPAASVSQRVGVTDLRIEYSSPAVKGRKVWGDLVPYGELWRTGANAATKITLSRDAKIAGTEVKAGTYSLLTIPQAGKWTLILNSDSALPGTRGYDQKKDVLRAEIETRPAPHRERLTFLFDATTDARSDLRLEWGELAAIIPIETPVEKQAAESINAAAGDLATAARYLLDANREPERALLLAESAVAIDPGWVNTFVLARAQAANNRFADATANARKAQELGLKAEYFFWKEDVEKAIAEWSAKAQ